jgi:preprotein translocase subunit SecD
MNVKKNWRILVLVLVVLFSVSLLMTKGLVYGIDFTGGTELKLVVEDVTSPEEVDIVVSILKNRLNGMGLKSTQVLKEADNKHITVKVSTTDTDELANVKNIINQQAIFEQIVEGELCAKGEEISLDISKQGGVFIQGTTWRISVKTSGEGPVRCGEVMEGKAGSMTDIFLDRPDNAFILLESSTCNELSNEAFSNHQDDIGYTVLSFLEERALLPVVCYTTTEKEEPEVNETLLEGLGVVIENDTEDSVLDLSATKTEMGRLFAEGKTKVILIENTTKLPQELQDRITELELTSRVYLKGEDQPYHEDNNPDGWVDIVTGIKSSLRIGEGLTYGSPIYESIFSGGGRTTAEATATAEQFKIWLTSGNLPVETKIILERPNLPELGQQFLRYAIYIAFIAIGLVALIISIRYREKKISLAILTTAFSEIVMILGFASWMSWELDLAAMAGIIAAIGTGVDHQIIITDETLRGERKREEKQIWDVKQSINRAFFIIMASAVTTICAMLPLMSIIDLRGFAFTSIIGILIGLLISRPAYGRLIELIT